MMTLIEEATAAIQTTTFDQQIKAHTATIDHLTDSLIADLAQFSDKQQRYVMGLKDGITQFQTIYCMQENHLKYPTMGAYDCTLDLSKLVNYLAVCAVRLFVEHHVPLPTLPQRQMAEKIFQSTIPLFNALWDWRKNSTSLLELSYQQMEQYINELAQRESTFDDEQMRLTIQKLQSIFKKLSELYAIDNLARKESAEGDEDASIARTHPVIELSSMLYVIQHVKITPDETKTVTKLARAARVFEHVWRNVKNIQSITVGVIPAEMPELNVDYD